MAGTRGGRNARGHVFHYVTTEIDAVATAALRGLAAPGSGGRGPGGLIDGPTKGSKHARTRTRTRTWLGGEWRGTLGGCADPAGSPLAAYVTSAG
jgi:hypothetical protein